MDKTSSGLDENLAGALAYLLGFVSGGAFLLTEPSNRFVRFHALQSVVVFGGLSLVWLIAMSIPPLGWFVAFVIIPPLAVILWLLLIYKAYQGERFKVPFVGDLVDPYLR